MGTKQFAHRKILVADDDSAICRLIEEALTNEGFSVEVCGDGRAAVEKVRANPPHLVILDQDMPGLKGLEALKEIKKTHPEVDAMFVSANSGQALVTESLDCGADDYIRKPFSFRELVSRVKVRFRLRDLREELEAVNKKLADLSERDDLTGLFNMRSMYDRIDHELKRMKRTGKCVSAIMLDMDYFKTVNDDHDHLFGSFVLKEVGKIIKSCVRDTDLPARYGGDEYLVILTDTDEAGTQMFADRIRNSIQSHHFVDGESEIKLTVSIGFSVAKPDGLTSARDLVRFADHALYEAKEQGRNRVVSAANTTPRKKIKVA